MKTRNLVIFQKIGLMSRNDSFEVPNMVAIDGSVTTSVYAALTSYSGRYLLTNATSGAVYGTVSSSGDCCLWVGTNGEDNTPVAGTDYCSDNGLKSPCSTTDISPSSIAISPTKPIWDSNTLKVASTITRTFTANVDLVIREIGYIKSCEKQYLLERIVLDDAHKIEVTAGDKFSVSIVIEC